MNKNIKEAKRKFQIILIMFITFQIFFLFIINIFFNKFSLELGPNDIDFELIKKVFIIIGILLSITLDILFFIKFIYRLHTMINVEPKKCIIEDFIIYPYGRESNYRIDYKISPLVKDIEDNKLYFTYGDYNLSYYTTAETSMNKKLVSKIIFRKDGSKVEIGDVAYFFIKKKVKVNINIDESNNIIRLNNQKMFYFHVNENYDINIFNKITFFEGIVEVENISKE